MAGREQGDSGAPNPSKNGQPRHPMASANRSGDAARRGETLKGRPCRRRALILSVHGGGGNLFFSGNLARRPMNEVLARFLFSRHERRPVDRQGNTHGDDRRRDEFQQHEHQEKMLSRRVFPMAAQKSNTHGQDNHNQGVAGHDFPKGVHRNSRLFRDTGAALLGRPQVADELAELFTFATGKPFGPQKRRHHRNKSSVTKPVC